MDRPYTFPLRINGRPAATIPPASFHVFEGFSPDNSAPDSISMGDQSLQVYPRRMNGRVDFVAYGEFLVLNELNQLRIATNQATFVCNLSAAATSQDCIKLDRSRLAKKRAWVAMQLRDSVSHSSRGTPRAPDFHLSCTLSDKTDLISCHAYPRAIIRHLQENPDAIALDVGAGLKFTIHDRIVNLEIFDYPSTDVLSLGDNIPFPDETFDVVFSSAVLEHVSNPFDVAREKLRVLKRGGLLFSGMPFLQPEHGYPHHYFNATLQGHLQLYEGRLEGIEVCYDPAGHPIRTLISILGHYRSMLPAQTRKQFESMTINELLSKSFRDWLKEDISTRFSKDGINKLASSTIITGRKVI
jgi:SAM-dependent methyltransferase